MFDENTEFNSLTELPLIDTMLSDILASEPKEDIRKIEISDRCRGFVFFPSHLKSYVLLKKADADLALLFLEDLIAYGITGSHISNNPIIRGLMENITPVLDNQYTKYLEYCARDKHKFDYYNHPEDRIHANSLEQIINATNGVNL